MADTAVGTVVQPGADLRPGDRVASPNGRAELRMQPDGNLVLYNAQGLSPLWASATAGRGGVVARMQADGNLVVYDASNRPLWASGTQGHPGTYAKVQDDGNFVLYGPDGAVRWASGTQDFARHDNRGFSFDDVWSGVKAGVNGAVDVGNALGFAGVNLNTAIVTGQNPVDALKADVANFKKSSDLAKLVTSGDYANAWKVATNDGKVYDAGLPAPPGHSYSAAAQPNTPGVIAQHPVVRAAKVVRVTGFKLPPITVPIQKRVVADHAGVPVTHPSIAVAPAPHPALKRRPWWELGGAAGGAAAGFLAGGPVGAAAGGLIGFFGGRHVESKRSK